MEDAERMLCKKAAWKVGWAGTVGTISRRRSGQTAIHMCWFGFVWQTRGCAVSEAVDAQTRKECFEIFVDHLDDVGRVTVVFLPPALSILILSPLSIWFSFDFWWNLCQGHKKKKKKDKVLPRVAIAWASSGLNLERNRITHSVLDFRRVSAIKVACCA